MSKDPDLDYIPNINPNHGFNPRPKSLRSIGGAVPVISKPINFEKAKRRLKATGKLSMDDFRNTAELGAFIDWHNKTVTDKNEETATEHILWISKQLADMQTQKTFLLGQ